VNWEQVKPKPKVAAGGVAWAVAFLLVVGLETFTSTEVSGDQTLILVSAVAAVAAWAMPDTPPWKRERP
jgi:hypothetical protein